MGSFWEHRVRALVVVVALVVGCVAAGLIGSAAAAADGAATGVVSPAYTSVQPLPASWIRGVAVYTFGDSDPYADSYGPGVDATLQQAVQDGANTVNFVVECVAATVNSTTFTCGDSTSTSCAATADDGNFTISDACLEQEMTEARGLGLKVGLYPIVETADNYNRSDYAPQDAHGDPDWPDWWTSYDQVILRYAGIAQDYGASLYSVGSELNTADNCGGLTTPSQDICTAQWDSLISQVRQVFNGELYYSADNYPVDGTPTTETDADPDWASFPAWKELDLIGVEGYWALEGPAGSPGSVPDPTVPQLVADWRDSAAYEASDILQTLANLAASDGKPVIASEMGAGDSPYAANSPALACPASEGCGTDPSAQANVYSSFFDALAPQSWFDGAFAWDFQTNRPTDPSASANDGIGQTDPRGLPAEQVLSGWYTAQPAAATTMPTTTAPTTTTPTTTTPTTTTTTPTTTTPATTTPTTPTGTAPTTTPTTPTGTTTTTTRAPTNPLHPPATPTSRQIAAVLQDLVAVTHKGAIPAILKAGGYAEQLTTPSGGTITVTWVVGTGRRATTVASSQIHVAKAARLTFKIALTRSGRRLLAGSRQLMIHATVGFTPTGGKLHSSSMALTLKR